MFEQQEASTSVDGSWEIGPLDELPVRERTPGVRRRPLEQPRQQRSLPRQDRNRGRGLLLSLLARRPRA